VCGRTKFERPEALDLARKPNPDLAFGHGPNQRLGAPLARITKLPFSSSSVAERAEGPESEEPAGAKGWVGSTIRLIFSKTLALVMA
jgi:hypothetical protein